MVEEAAMAAGRTFAGRTIQFWVIAVIAFGSATVATDAESLPVWVRGVCALIAAIGAIWVLVDTGRHVVTTLRMRRKSHGH